MLFNFFFAAKIQLNQFHGITFIARLPIDTTEGELKRTLYWELDTCYDIEILPYTAKNKYRIVVHCKRPFIDEMIYAEKLKKLQDKPKATREDRIGQFINFSAIRY